VLDLDLDRDPYLDLDLDLDLDPQAAAAPAFRPSRRLHRSAPLDVVVLVAVLVLVAAVIRGSFSQG
jgi:hypothetical protein